MKKILLLLLSVALFNVYGATGEYDFIDHQEMEQIALTTIDNICGDTWCEGDYDFSFDSLKCDYFGRSNCQLSYQYLEWGEFSDETPEGRVVAKHPVTCQLKGITSFSQMYDELDQMLSTGHWYWAQLSDMMYDQVTECIDNFYPEY